MAAVKESKSEKSRQDYYDTKQQAMEYYTENGVPNKMEEILNSMFYDNPYDVYGHLANYFEKYAKTPLITKIKSRTALDSRGQPTLMTSVYCTVKNIDKCLTTVVSPNPHPHVLDNGKTEDKEKEEKERKDDIQAGIELIENEISEKLTKLDPCHQEEIDQLLYNLISEKKAEKDAEKAVADENISPTPQPAIPPTVESPSNKKKSGSGKKGKAASVIIAIPDEAREVFLPGSSIVSSISQAVCCTGASISNQPLYHYIAALFNKPTDKYHLPLPMATILQAGKASSGKLKCVKEFMLIPNPSMSLSEAVNHIQEIYNHIGKNILHKTGVSGRYVNDIGALCPVLERVEQGLDLLQEAITSVGLKPGEDFNIALNIAAHEMFEFDKGKYEITTGQLKSPDDLVEFWADIITKYPSVIALIDPLRKQERAQWMKLCDRISSQCYIIGDYVYHRPALLKSEELHENFQASGIVYKLEHMNTITDIHTCQRKMEEAKNITVITANQGDTTDSFIVDLAVGLQAKFIKIGAPCRGERIIKFNRLVQIEDELKENGKYSCHEEHVFHKIDLPPVPETDNLTPTASPSPRKDGKKK